MATPEEQSAFELVREHYGDDAIVVYRPKDLDYFITTSGNSPICTFRILFDVTGRMESQRFAKCETCKRGPCVILSGECSK